MASILVVDDSPVNLKIIRGLLGDLYEVLTASDGRAAIQLAAASRPDLILLDILMPEMDGLAVCEVLKQHEATAEIPIIFITVVSDSNNIVKAFEAGGQDYITKPFGARELCARIKTHLELKEAKEALKAYAKQLEAKNLELNKALAKLEIVAITDYLTKLPNRKYIMQRINDEVARLKRTAGDMVLILVDIDDFKKINDNYGHNSGDLVLQTIAKVLRTHIREQDVVARWGGDEFLLMLPDTDLSGGQIVAKKLQAAVGATTYHDQEEEVSVTVTFGVAAYNLQLDVDANIKRADDALYTGKKGIALAASRV
jgi:diguanylate cyclase (GGDEF)-like protein